MSNLVKRPHQNQHDWMRVVSDADYTVIQKWGELIVNASSELSKAQQSLLDDKKRRKSSVVAQLIDWFTSTPEEKDVRAKTKRLATISADASKAAQQWIVNKARLELESSVEDLRRHTEQALRIESIRKRYDSARRLLNLARGANSKLNEARLACESAHNAEFLDAVSTNKVFSVLSTVETSDAAFRVREANNALKKLSNALPKQVEAGGFHTLDDSLDLVIDLFVAPAFDFLSFANMQRLDTVAMQCQEAVRSLAPLLARLQELNTEITACLSTELEARSAIEMPYLQAAADLVPSTIKVQVPNSLGNG